MPNVGRRALRWAAPVAVVAIGLAACGDGHDQTTRTAVPNPEVSDPESPSAYCRWTSRFGVHLEPPPDVAWCQRSDDGYGPSIRNPSSIADAVDVIAIP
jgi:hypothetical protein